MMSYYPKAKSYFKNGIILNNCRVLNSSVLILANDEKFENQEILSIVPE